MGVECDLDTHELGVDHVDPVPVAEPDLGVDLDHAADGVVRLAQVQQVVVPQVPLAVRGAVEDCHCPVSQGGQHAALHVPAGNRSMFTSSMGCTIPCCLTYTMESTESLSLMEWMQRFHWDTALCT